MTSLAPSPPPSPWIVRPTWDLGLVVLAPLFLLPALLWWRGNSGDGAVYAAVMTFGALGHHLPGMLRAYGDAALFRRFKTRFLLAPLFLIAVCAGFKVAGLHGLAVVSLLWGIWHGWMQTYGFARIYDAKRRSIARATARIDFALCATWFTGAVVSSPYRSFQILDYLALCGVGAPSAAALGALRTVAVLAMAASGIVYLAHSVQRARAGHPTSAIKHVLLASSLGLWWVSTNLVSSLIFGLALFEIFHDIQYLAIVWAFNRRRATDGASGPFTRWIFRGGGVGAGMYVGLVLGYGALGPLAETVGEARVRDALAGVLVASQLLHFYFDGFIWKVREPKTRASLGIDAVGTVTGDGRRGSRHLALWSLLVVPLGGLGIAELRGTSLVEASATLAAALPEHGAAHARFGLALAAEGRPREAVIALRRAHELDPGDPELQHDLARSLAEAAEAWLAAGDAVQARSNLLEARALEPALPQALRGLIGMRATSNEAEGSLQALALLELLVPEPDLVLDRARLLAQFGRYPEAMAALRAYREAGGQNPDGSKLEQWLGARMTGR